MALNGSLEMFLLLIFVFSKDGKTFENADTPDVCCSSCLTLVDQLKVNQQVTRGQSLALLRYSPCAQSWSAGSCPNVLWLTASRPASRGCACQQSQLGTRDRRGCCRRQRSGYGCVDAFVCWGRGDRDVAWAESCARHRTRRDGRRTFSPTRAPDGFGLSGKPSAWELERKWRLPGMDR